MREQPVASTVPGKDKLLQDAKCSPSTQGDDSYLTNAESQTGSHLSSPTSMRRDFSQMSALDQSSDDPAANRNLFFAPKFTRPKSALMDDASSIVSKQNEGAPSVLEEDDDPELSLNSLDDVSFLDVPGSSGTPNQTSDSPEPGSIARRKPHAADVMASVPVSLNVLELNEEARNANNAAFEHKALANIRDFKVASVPGLATDYATISGNDIAARSETSTPSISVSSPGDKSAPQQKKKQDKLKIGTFYIQLDHKFSSIDALAPELLEVLDIQKTDALSKLPKDTSVLYPANEKILMETLADGKQIFRACSLPALIDLLVSEKTEADLEFVTDFLTTYTYFADPVDVARLICLRFLDAKEKLLIAANNLKKQGKTTPAAVAKDKQVDWDAMVQMRLLNVIRKWVDNHSIDFENNRNLCRVIVKFLKLEVQLDQKKAPFVNSIVQKLEEKVSWFSADTELSSGIPRPKRNQDSASIETQGPKSKLTIMDINAETLAQEITLHEFELFRKIPLNEFYNQSWSIKDKELREKTAPNLVAFIGSFNRMAYGVASEIVSQPKLGDRVEVVKKFIYIANLCAKMRNFNTCFEIVAGLNLGAVSRLKKTWKAIPKKYLEVWDKLSALVTSEGNYKSYRNVMQNIIGFPPADPIVPYLGMFLADMTFIEDGNPTYFDDEQVIYSL